MSGRSLSVLMADGLRLAPPTVAFSLDSRWLATGSFDNTARVFEATSGKEISKAKFGGFVFSVAFNPDGLRLAVGSAKYTVHVFEITSGKKAYKVRFGGSVTSVAFSPDGRWLAAGSSDGTGRVFDATSGVEVFRVRILINSRRGRIGRLVSAASG